MSLTIRPLSLSDLPALVPLANNPGVSRYLSTRFPYPYTDADGHAFLSHAAQYPNEIFAICLDDCFIGCIGTTGTTHPFNCHATEIGYWLGEQYWGKGYATHAVKLLLGRLEGRFKKLYAHVVEGNEGSKRVLEKCGFEQEGFLRAGHYRDGTFQDMYMLAIVFSSPPVCRKGHGDC